ncbi:hypothetical protein [Methanobrevibacter sp.]
MNKKIVIILAILAVCILLASPVAAKQKVKVKISTDDCITKNKGYIVIKLLDKNNREIRSNGMIKYTVTDESGHYKWVSKSYGSGIRVKYDVGNYNVNVEFKGDSKYKPAEKNEDITVTNDFDAYTYYDNHNWGLNQEIDDYIGDNYWNEEIYDDVDDPENEAWNI